jgi:hypothetical protein
MPSQSGWHRIAHGALSPSPKVSSNHCLRRLRSEADPVTFLLLVDLTADYPTA